MWLRLLLVLAILWGGSKVAHAQAPSEAFFAGRSNDDLRVLASNPRNDVLLRRTAATKLVMSLADGGDFDAADAAGREFAKNIDPRAPQHAKAVRRRSHARVVALLALGVALGLALLRIVAEHRSIARATQAVRRLAPVLTFFVVFAGLGGGYVASTYENSSPSPFVWFAACLLPLLVTFRVWGALGSPRVEARVFRSVLAVAATVAVGFLVVEQVNPTYLEGFGL